MVTTVIRYMVPLYVTVQDGRVRRVQIDDSLGTISDPPGAELVDTDEQDAVAALNAADDVCKNGDEPWPSWEFGALG